MRITILLSLALIAFVGDALAGSVSISEVLYDADGSDGGKTFVELYGEGGFDLDGFELVAINGSDGKAYLTVDLTGYEIPSDGFFVIADGLSDGTTSIRNADWIVSNIDLQNGPDSLRLVSDGLVVDAVGYGEVGASGTFAGEGSAADDVAAGSSLSRLFADVDTDDNADDFRASLTPTPGTGPLEMHAVPTPEGLGLAALGMGLVALLKARRRYSWKQ
jgi:hypothetical protein